MKNHYVNRILSTIMAVVMLFAYSCKDPGESPQIPPQESFSIDFSQFPDNSGKMAEGMTNVNWVHSGLTAGVWNLVIGVTLAIPVLAYAEALKQTPTYVRSEEKWLWKFDVTGAAGATYTAKLYGWTDAENVNWEMYLSKRGDFTDFLWYTGQNKTDLSSGNWTLNKDPNNAVEFILIEWNRFSDGTADIKYTNIEPGAAGNGGYITYGTTTDATFDAFYDVFVIEQNHLTQIEWNLTTHDGRVADQTKFGDAEWHCWDDMLTDVDCN